MYKNSLVVIILLLATYSSFARLFFPNFLKYQTYTEGVSGRIFNMVPFQNTGYLMAGWANTYDFLIKTDLNGNKEWEYFSDEPSYGGNTATTISKSGNCLFAGSKRVSNSQGVYYSSIRLRSISSSGDLLWEKYYDNGAGESPVWLSEMDDGGFMIAGITAGLNNFRNDLIFLRTDNDGNLLWKKIYGASDSIEVIYSAEKTADNGLMVLAHKTMENRTWILRLNALGDTLWTKTLYYKSGNRLLSIKRTVDNSYICAGMSESLHLKREFWVLKIDDEGNSIWTKSYSRTNADTAKSIDTVPGGGYCFAGNSGPRCILMKIGSAGDSLWSLDYGYSKPVMPVSLIITPSGQFALGGNTGSDIISSNDVFFLLFESEKRSTTYSEFSNWEIIDTSNSLLPADYISRISVDSSNRVWLVIWDEFNSKYHVINQSGNTWKNFDLLSLLQITNMTATSSGHMWFTGDNSVCHYDGVTVSNTPVSIQAFDVAPINNAEAYVGCTYGLYKLNNGTLTKLVSVADTSGIKHIYQVMVDAKGNVWYSSIMGVAVKNSTNTVMYTPENSPLTGGVREIKSVADNVWIATSEGLVKNANGVWTVFDSTNTLLPSNGVNAFSVDTKGNVLIGCDRGFFNLNENKLYDYNNSPLPSNIINCIDVDNNGNVLIGTNQGLVIIHNNGLRNVCPVLKENVRLDKNAKIAHILKSSKRLSDISNSLSNYSCYNLSGKLICKKSNNLKTTKTASGVMIGNP